ASEVQDRVQRGDLAGAATLLGWVRDSITPPTEGTEDPYVVQPFTRFWTVGQRQGDAKTITLAAASIWVLGTTSAQRGVTLLEQARADAPEAQAEAIDLALLIGYEQLHDHAHALDMANALAKRSPQSARAFYAQTAHLRALNRFKEAETLAEQRL